MIGTYNYWLVALSVVVAIFASYTALDLAKRARMTRGRPARAWLVAGAFFMGIGIWSTHFIGMLAGGVAQPTGYNLPLTVLSLVVAIAVSGFAFYTVSREALTWGNLLFGGVLMSFGIWAAHYSGMAAMKISPLVTYQGSLVAISVVIAMVASHAALFIAFTLRGDPAWRLYAKIASAAIMGGAVTGMHYIALAATRFSHDALSLTTGGVDHPSIAIALSGLAVLILCVTLGLSVIDSRLAARAVDMAPASRLQRFRLCVRDLAQQYYELAAAEARDAIFISKDGHQVRRADSPQFIGREMSARVVELRRTPFETTRMKLPPNPAS
jgi:NO-binding membrane sensor protein with MHYT domain